MFEMPSPYSRPFWTTACGWKPGTSFSHGSRPEYDVSMWPLNISVLPPPVPCHVPSAFARPSSTCCHCPCRPRPPPPAFARLPPHLQAQLLEQRDHQLGHRLLVAGEAVDVDQRARRLDEAILL